LANSSGLGVDVGPAVQDEGLDAVLGEQGGGGDAGGSGSDDDDRHGLGCDHPSSF
jgi:hypothetical protein